MKLQHLAIIFIIIIIPIILVFSYFLDLEASTIKIQTDYDEKLIEATSEAMEAYEINTVDWATNYNSLFNMRRRNVTRSIDVFVKSLSNKLGVGGTAKENILVYIPAIVYTMYDGYYIYSPTYVPKTVTYKSNTENDLNGRQVFYYPDAVEEKYKFSIEATHDVTAGQPMFKYRNNADQAPTGYYYGEPFTVEIDDAEMEFKHVLKTFVPYSIQLNNDYTINYTLDNYIRVFGKEESREGYIIEENIALPKTKIENKIDGITIGDIIGPERLCENVPIKTGDNIEIKKCYYIYTSNNDKIYFDSNGFFNVVGDYRKEYLQPVDANNIQAQFKKVLIRESINDMEYIELYQLLNKNEGNVWYRKDETGQMIQDPNYTNRVRISRECDCSAINYWTECYCFNKWLDVKGFDRDSIISRRKDAIIDNITNNLSLSISSYSKNSRADYTIPKLSNEDWEQAISNISLITFFQGVKIGLRTYNNYSIVSSSENNEFITNESIYYTDTNNEYYHRFACSELGDAHGTVQGYRNTEFKVKSYEVSSEDIKYYYSHNGTNDLGKVYGNQACFSCIVNRNIIEPQESEWWNKIKENSIAREKYIQMCRTRLTTANSIAIDSSASNSAEFNAQFEAFYSGVNNNRSARDALALLELVKKNNEDNSAHQIAIYVYVWVDRQVDKIFRGTEIDEIIEHIANGILVEEREYEIKTQQKDANGYITIIYIEEYRA